MDRRTHEGPMDFEYQNGTGPMDGRSPFAQISMNARNAIGAGNDNSAKKRSFSIFGSPSKSTSTYPSLREPASQPHFFAQPSSPTRPLPSLPTNARNNPLFSTPRKLDVDFASSGGETPKSPEHNDSDATPDTNTNSNMGFRNQVARFGSDNVPVFNAGGSPSRKDRDRVKDMDRKDDKERRGSWFSRAWDKTGISPSPGRGEVAKASVYTNAMEKRIRKKRSREVQRALARRRASCTDSDFEGDSSIAAVPRSRQVSGSKTTEAGTQDGDGTGKKGPHWMYTLFDFLTTHPTLPHILSFYAQLFLNLFLIAGFVYILYSFWATIRSDVDKKSSEAVAELLAEMAVCAQQYTDNRCERNTRVPAMEVVCNNWEKCMSRDPRSVGRARVSAHTFAEIFNSFIEPISYKAMIFTALLIFGSVAISNFAFSIFRDKAAAAQAANHHHYYNGPPVPPTPQRSFSGGHQLQDGYWTPFQPQQGLEPAPSQYPVAGIEGQGSPVRRLQYH
ncbi:hypothetical protein M8818_007531 [Zalaria obscura]|uniref:Uncharacterized protein n=1 Tax=Zalaria obscura TaxID=2024903 RepID=A0ACC3S474_9PEZI